LSTFKWEGNDGVISSFSPEVIDHINKKGSRALLGYLKDMAAGSKPLYR